MPAKGKHRRPRPQRLTRSMAVAGTGGAALALPLMGATGAHAATPQSISARAPQSIPAAEKAAVKQATAKRSATARAAHRTYTVVPGDYLSKIARDQDVSGGWHRLYADNRQAVGDNPSLIHPGLKLVLGGRGATASGATDSGTRQGTRSSTPSPASTSDGSTSTASTATASGFTLPVSGAAVGTGYHVSGSMWSSGYHTGVDFVVPTGTPVKAVGEGTVVTAGWGGAYGNQVVIRLADGYYAQYGHLSALSVSAGQTVTAGQQIGLSGATGNVTGPHLHFEIRTTPDYGSDVDPVGYLRSKGLAVG
ncbi:M23 family metallopeptidase [Streptomyces arenae]|uniref:M23 family metallopeptidase n=1 Tax=Streptomyces arenae TaxID=29301 RepID=UPI00265A2997|nr:peptidoglycan DD-metalloendopeptidase family protein [Streptomyces arenae]MCG7209061.1 peptidoglycan DD-metalloendopeptidase family protein [Streptomyces arenae]